MSSVHTRWLLALGAVTIFAVASQTPDTASASDQAGLTAESGRDTLGTAGLQVLGAKELYRMQERPFMRVPLGAKLLVRAPAGVTEADLHRAATSSPHANSPLAVPGAKLSVRRSGDLYELHVTAPVRSAAIEILRRAQAL